MKPHILHYIVALICGLCAAFTLGIGASWWLCAIPSIATLVNLTIALDLHSKMRMHEQVSKP